MSRWLIDGIKAGTIIGSPTYANGCYSVDISRDDATLEQIEGIDWAKPTIRYTGDYENERGLPEGYGFDVDKIEYLSNIRVYRVHLKVASQYLGDVTGYQAEITEKDSTIAEQAAQLAELEAAYDDN